MTAGMTREAALELLQEYNQEPFHIVHALTVEGVMRWFAGELGYGSDADFWAMAGLLHDIDFERWPDEHCKKDWTFWCGISDATFQKCSGFGSIQPEEKI